jgi:hypothetical protein
VKETSDKIVGGASSDLDKARRIYDWVVDNTFRDAKVRGCGIGDIASMLKSGNLGGKCADLNPLYVGLARAAGLPARDVYGLRVAPSAFGYRSLGANSGGDQGPALRAECSWTASAGARGPGRRAQGRAGGAGDLARHPRTDRAGAVRVVETNWLAYNAHDVDLPGAGAAHRF